MPGHGKKNRPWRPNKVAVRGALTTTFPQVKVVVDAPVQMERELTLLRQKAGSVSPRDLEPLMAAAGGALPDGRVPSAVEFAPGELRLRGVTLALMRNLCSTPDCKLRATAHG